MISDAAIGIGMYIGFAGAVAMFAMAWVARSLTRSRSGKTLTEIKNQGLWPAPSAYSRGEKLVKIIYILADMRGRGQPEARERLEYVQQRFVHMLRMGLYPVAVGVNTEFTMRDFALPVIFEEAGKELATRCDGIFMMPGCEQDPESTAVFNYVKEKKPNMRIFHASEAHMQEKLKAWAAEP
jgi:hypothetical protein